ncbi:MAG: hypothetical protein QOE72_556 [Chloroflexota bacterium]|nr:hypothetical protein [Chloroflexota bacterium]
MVALAAWPADRLGQSLRQITSRHRGAGAAGGAGTGVAAGAGAGVGVAAGGVTGVGVAAAVDRAAPDGAGTDTPPGRWGVAEGEPAGVAVTTGPEVTPAVT